MKKSTNVARRAKNKIGSAMMQLAVMASSLSVSGAATAYYASRRGNYNTRKGHNYLVDNGLGGISKDLLKYKKSHKIKTGATTDPIGGLFLKKTASTRELVLVDRNIKDYYLFSKLSKPGVEVIELPKEANGLDFLIKTLGQYQDLSAVHIFSHAKAGELFLGNTNVDKKALQNNVEAFNKLNKAIVKGGDLLFYGCELGKGKEGEEFLDIIKGNTHVDVAASNNLTGNADYNGDWELEIRKGDITTTPLSESVAMKDFTGVLQYILQDFGYILPGPTADTGCPTDRLGYTYGYYSLISGNYTVCGFMGIGPGDSGNGFGGTTVNMSHWFDGVYTPAFLGESGTEASNSGTHAIEVKSSTLFQLTNVVADEWPPNPAGSNGYTFSNVRIIGYIDGGGTIASSAHSTVDDQATTNTFTFDSDELADFAGVSLTKFRLEFRNDTGLATGMRLVSYTTAEPVDNDGNLTAAAGVTEPVGLDTTADTVGEAVDVFDFTISDGGGGDGLATTISQVVVNVSGTSTNAERGQVTWRLNGPDVSNETGTYNAGSETVTFSGLSISIADGGNETYTVNAYYNDNTNLTEDHTFILSIDGDTDLTVGASGTQMGTTSPVTNGAGSTIDVVATQLAFTTQPAGSVSGSALTTQPVVAAQDDFSNTDVDFTETITVTEASAGTLTNNTQAATAGVATFTNLIYTATADQQSFTLTANDQDGVGTDLPTVNANSVTSDVVATKLVFTTQPAPTTVNSGDAASFTTVPVISATDANDIVDTGYATDITLAEVNGAGTATMTATGDTDGDGSTVSITPSSGVATFTGMQITYTTSGSSSETFNLRASSGGLTTVNSSQFTAIVAPTVSSVSVPANATYIAGQNLDFTVNASQNITVDTGGGTPQIALTVGATTRQASYLSGSGTSALVFRYTVQAGDSDTDGIAVAGTIDANGGTMQDGSGNDLNTTLNSVGSTASVLVDAVAPSVSSVSVPANGTYTTGQDLDFTINFTENITVNTGGGTPQMSITIGATTRQATYISGSGTSALVFRYTIQSGELDTDGIAVGTLAANGGTLRDGAGNDATLTLNSVGSTTAVLVGYATVTWTGATDNNWETASNWDTNEVPSSAADVIIPSGLTNYPTASSPVTFNSLTMNSGATFIPESTVTGNITYNRNLPATDWYLISMPIAGEVMEDVITTHPLASGTGPNLGLSYYQNSGGSPWGYVTAATTGSFTNGYGYAINLTAPGDLSVTGTANTSDVSSGIATGSRTNFNLLGNPFTAYINSATFAAANTALLSEETVWLWNGTQYVTYNAVSPIEIAPVQGFLVEAGGNGNVVFSTSDLSHQASGTFMKQTTHNEQETLSSFELFVSGKSEQSSTKVFFVEGKTTGFDNGYDSKLFGDVDYTFAVYTGMVLGNDSKKLAIQTLPGIEAEAVKIPVGLIAEAGKTITFSIQAKNLPMGVSLLLEDKLNNTYVNLLEGDHSVTLKNSVAGLGKFYIHTTATLDIEDIENALSLIKIYKSAAKELSIEGLKGPSQVVLYSLTGEKVMQIEMRSTGINKIDLQRSPIGVYIVRVSSESGSGSVTKKIILE